MVTVRSHCFSCIFFSLFPVSEDKEKDILLRINSCPKAVYHDPVARRFRKKLILRQVHICCCCPVCRKKGGEECKQSLFRFVRRDAKKRTREEWLRRNLRASSAPSSSGLFSPFFSFYRRRFFSCPFVHVLLFSS